jgi:archaemetzincin
MEKQTRGMRIWLFWTADVDPEVLNHLRENLAMVFCGTVEPGRTFELREKELHTARGQYKSTPILWRLRILKPDRDFLLAVTEADLYADGLNFVFGEAYPAARCAIISLARLKVGYPGKPFTAELFLRRALTEAVHEVGHLLGIGHCPQPTCVMHFSNSLYDTDRKGPTFCSRCQEFLP